MGLCSLLPFELPETYSMSSLLPFFGRHFGGWTPFLLVGYLTDLHPTST